eukprot:scaffold1519_cov166-Amphora_coffeaeformis.AAC.9
MCATGTDHQLGGNQVVDVVRIAQRILGHPVDAKRSFFENGGDFVQGVEWLQELKVYGLVSKGGSDWRSLMTSNLSAFVEEIADDSSSPKISNLS